MTRPKVLNCRTRIKMSLADMIKQDKTPINGYKATAPRGPFKPSKNSPKNGWKTLELQFALLTGKWDNGPSETECDSIL